jgi:hypothetical protein
MTTKYPMPDQIAITRIEFVRWLDACGPDCVTTLQAPDIAELAPLGTTDVGFVVKEDDECIVLAPEINDEGGVRRPICIPKCCVLMRIQLFGSNPRKENHEGKDD